MEKLIQVADGVSIRVNSAGLVTMQNRDKKRSIALVQFARAVFANPTLVTVERVEDIDSFLIVTADGNRWWFDSEALTIVKDEEFIQVPEMAAKAEVAEPRVAESEQQVEARQSTKEQKVPRWAIALAEILKTQGFSDEQIAAIISQTTESVKTNKPKVFVDTSTPEGRLVAELMKLRRKLLKLGVEQSKTVFDDDMEIELAEKILILRWNGKEFRITD